MFAFLATRNPKDNSTYTSELRAFAEQQEVTSNAVRTLHLPNFQLDYFDTGHEMQHYTDGRYVSLMVGVILNRDSIATDIGVTTLNDAKLVFDLFQTDRESLSAIDGHVSVMIFDAEEQRFYLLGDRFLRYSVVFSIGEVTQISSHTALLYPFLAHRSIDMDALCQSIHFRWLTGHRRLFSGVQQVLPGSITGIDKLGRVQRDAYWKLEFQRESNVDLDYWTGEVNSALDRTFSKIAQRHEVIAIPLSGGVDSSLLLAKAKVHFKECIAVTGRFRNGTNPELENACNVAKYLGVRHVIAEIDDKYIRDFFPKAVRLHEQPLRNFSDLALGKVLQVIRSESDAFVYGEAADTLFGLKVVHRIANAQRAGALLQNLPLVLQRLASKLIPSRPARFAHLKSVLAEGSDRLVHSIERIRHSTPPCQVFPCAEKTPTDIVLNEFLGHDSFDILDRASIQLLATGVMNHIENTGRLASKFNLEMYVPFVLDDLRSVALRLPAEMQGSNGNYKLVLRELACRYLPREFVYTQKFGFPTPAKNWLKGPLSNRVRAAIEGKGSAAHYYCPDSLSALSVDDDFEHLWFAICLDELISHVDSPAFGVRAVA